MDRISSSPYHDQMIRFAAPLQDFLGINHFWYYKITFSGNYSYLGTHSKWNAFCSEQVLAPYFSCLRHPDLVQEGISLMKASEDAEYQKVLKIAWEMFKINFNLNLVRKVLDGIEAFGFGSRYNDPQADERLLNELPLLHAFIKAFKSKNRKLFWLLEESQINLPDQFGAMFFECPKGFILPRDRFAFLRSLGMNEFFSLTPRELDVLKFIANGYPASFIAKNLRLSVKTVENYIAVIKSKLDCTSKVELIEKAKQIDSLGLFQ